MTNQLDSISEDSMYCKRNYCQCNEYCEIHPVCPLKLMKYTMFSCGEIKDTLSLRGSPQEVIFDDIMYLTGQAISLIVPKYLLNECGEKYEVCISDEVVIEDINNNKLNVLTVLSNDCSKYYITIPVNDGSFSECELVLRFMKLSLILKKLPHCKYESAILCNDAWTWVPSIIDDQI